MCQRIKVSEDTVAVGAALCTVHCTVGLRADVRAKCATILPFAKGKYRPNGETVTLRYVYLRGFG